MPVYSAALRGITGTCLVVRTVAGQGLPSFRIEGLKDAAMRETAVKVRSAIASSSENAHKATFNRRVDVFVTTPQNTVLPADGMGLDLPIAMALLFDAAGAPNNNIAAIGELSLRGEVRPVRGILAMVEALREANHTEVIVAYENVAEAHLVAGVVVRAASTLDEAMNGGTVIPRTTTIPTTNAPSKPEPDMGDVRGQYTVKKALEAAAVSMAGVLLIGGPGSGKTMLARRVAGILPPMTAKEALDVTRVHSAAGLNMGGGLIEARPFRAPHHTTTPPGLCGGGAGNPRPGEVSLAHNGVLMLDEVTEFTRQSIETLGGVLRDGAVELMRSGGTARFPARTMVIATANPCPCGRRGAPEGSRKCSCDAETLKRYDARLAYVVEALGLSVIVRMEPFREADFSATVDETSYSIQKRVVRAHDVAVAQAKVGDGDAGKLVTPAARAVFTEEAQARNLSHAAAGRLMALAFSVSQLDGSAQGVGAGHMVTAARYLGKVGA